MKSWLVVVATLLLSVATQVGSFAYPEGVTYIGRSHGWRVYYTPTHQLVLVSDGNAAYSDLSEVLRGAFQESRKAKRAYVTDKKGKEQ